MTKPHDPSPSRRPFRLPLRGALVRGVRVRGALFRGILVVAAAGAGLAVAEVAAKRLDPFGSSYYRDSSRYLGESIVILPEAMRPDGRLFENAPDRCTSFRHFDFCTDEHGLRRPRDGDANDGGTRLLFLGDSVTLGWGVDDEETWIRRLEDELATADGAPVRCLNAGHLQYDTIQELDWLHAHGAELAPDRVVLTFVSNDVDDTWQTYQDLMAEQAAEPTAVERLESLASRYVPALYGAFVHGRVTRATGSADPEDSLPVQERAIYRERWPVCEAALDGLLAATRGLGAELLVLDHTVPAFPDLARWCEEHGVPFGDFRFTAEESARGVRLSAADAHANALGHELLAAKAIELLTRSGELVRTRP